MYTKGPVDKRKKFCWGHDEFQQFLLLSCFLTSCFSSLLVIYLTP